MIKLIATDLDGSLLDDNKQIPADLDEVLSALKDRGVAFAAVTGRNYDAVLPALGNRVQDMLCVCNNGANIYENGQLIIKHSLTKGQLHRALDLIKSLDNCDPLVLTLDKIYYTSGCEGFMKWAENPYSPMEKLDCYEDLYTVDEDIFKITVYDGSGDITNHSYPPLLKEFGSEASIYISGEIWVDIVSSKASKGYGLGLIQQKLGVTKAETMAFGDYYNDDSFLAQAGYPFVMDGGVDLLKQKYPYRAGDNNTGGVTRTIKEYVIDGSKKL